MEKKTTQIIRNQIKLSDFNEHSAPLYLTSSYVFEDPEDMKPQFSDEKEGLIYSRYGMPIVIGLSTVYGLSGIPQSLIDIVEIVTGPASTLYGSEAVGGLINVIKKNRTMHHLFLRMYLKPAGGR